MIKGKEIRKKKKKKRRGETFLNLGLHRTSERPNTRFSTLYFIDDNTKSIVRILGGPEIPMTAHLDDFSYFACLDGSVNGVETLWGTYFIGGGICRDFTHVT